MHIFGIASNHQEIESYSLPFSLREGVTWPPEAQWYWLSAVMTLQIFNSLGTLQSIWGEMWRGLHLSEHIIQNFVVRILYMWVLRKRWIHTCSTVSLITIPPQETFCTKSFLSFWLLVKRYATRGSGFEFIRSILSFTFSTYDQITDKMIFDS